VSSRQGYGEVPGQALPISVAGADFKSPVELVSVYCCRLPKSGPPLGQASPFPITSRCLWLLVEALTVGWPQV
jgi:hypothetical protein